MRRLQFNIICFFSILIMVSCKENTTKEKSVKETMNLSAKDILGNPKYLAISYGGYRKETRDIQPSVDEIKEDMKILSAIGIKILRTYNLQYPHAANVLKAISEIKQEDSDFEMYVMLGAWIDCENAWTDSPNHDAEDLEANTREIQSAVALANKYPDIVKILAVGNEAMVHWAWSYWVKPSIILKWVNHLQDLKQKGELSKDLWITSSDNFASWGGGDKAYHKKDLEQLFKAVDYVSMHTYPMHDTHYNPTFWGVKADEESLTEIQKIEAVMLRAKAYAIKQYDSVKSYMSSIGVKKPIHIGETGWASYTNDLYGEEGSKATDEFKQALYYKHMREWTNQENMSCFYFEAFDEQWKDPLNTEGSENHFGLFTVEGKAKYALWKDVDKGVFNGLKRGENNITKTYNGDKERLMKQVFVPDSLKQKVAH